MEASKGLKDGRPQRASRTNFPNDHARADAKIGPYGVLRGLFSGHENLSCSQFAGLFLI